MALRTLSTSSNLNAFVVGFNDTITADLATLNLAINGDPPGWNAWQQAATTGLVSQAGSNRPRYNQAYSKQGILIVPGRGILRLQPGDFVCYDTTTGWPFALSGDAAANGTYTHS